MPSLFFKRFFNYCFIWEVGADGKMKNLLNKKFKKSVGIIFVFCTLIVLGFFTGYALWSLI